MMVFTSGLSHLLFCFANMIFGEGQLPPWGPRSSLSYFESVSHLHLHGNPPYLLIQNKKKLLCASDESGTAQGHQGKLTHWWCLYAAGSPWWRSEDTPEGPFLTIRHQFVHLLTIFTDSYLRDNDMLNPRTNGGGRESEGMKCTCSSACMEIKSHFWINVFLIVFNASIS